MLVVFIRSIILILVVFAVMRFMGKRQIGQLQPYELVVTIMISDLATVPMQDVSIPVLFGVMPILCLLLIQLILSLLSILSNNARNIICGNPSILIENGIIKDKTLKKELYSITDLIEQLRNQGWSDITEIHTAVLETNGQISVIPKTMFRPANASMLNIPPKKEGITYALIMDGKVMKHNLTMVNKDSQWLDDKIKQLNYGTIKDILFASLSPDGTLSVQYKDNRVCSII